jgi:hypothetical protein
MVVILFGSFQCLSAQSGLQNIVNKYNIKTKLGFQLWGTYTMGQSLFDEEQKEYRSVDDRANMQIRRTRMSVTADLKDNLSFKLVGNLDLVGRDLLSATHGGANNDVAPRFGLWDLHLGWNMAPESDGAHLTIGYLSPQIGRASITGATVAPSFEKVWSQNYIRRTMIGTGPGRSMGMNLGGQFRKDNSAFALSYDIGLFNPVKTGFGGNSTGTKSSLLWTGRMVAHFGDPESDQYSMSHKTNYHNKRRGISLALQGSHQGNTDLFARSQVYGFDVLANYDRFNLDGQWVKIRRSSQTLSIDEWASSNVSYIRISYNIGDVNGQWFEPVFTWMQLKGAMDQAGQELALSAGTFAGEDSLFEYTLNYYLRPDIKLMISYTENSGDAGSGEIGVEINNYFRQGGVGGIQRGDMIGMGIVFVL